MRDGTERRACRCVGVWKRGRRGPRMSWREQEDAMAMLYALVSKLQCGKRPIPQRRDDGYGVAWWENQLPRLTNDVSIGDGALARNGVYRWIWTVQCIACTGQASRNIQSRGGTDAQIIRLDFIADGRRDRGPKLIPGSNSDTSSLPDFHLHSSPRTIVPHYTQRPWRKKRRQSTSRSFHPRLRSRVV